MEKSGLQQIFDESGEEDYGDVIPTDDDTKYLNSEELRKATIHAKYDSQKDKIRNHTNDLKEKIEKLKKETELLEDNVKRNDMFILDICDKEWKEIWG